MTTQTMAKTSSAAQWAPAALTVSHIKWYDPVRRFGFIKPHDGGGDIYFNWYTLLRNKIAEASVLPDMNVSYTFELPETAGKNRSVIFMRLEV